MLQLSDVEVINHNHPHCQDKALPSPSLMAKVRGRFCFNTAAAKMLFPMGKELLSNYAHFVKSKNGFFLIINEDPAGFIIKAHKKNSSNCWDVHFNSQAAHRMLTDYFKRPGAQRYFLQKQSGQFMGSNLYELVPDLTIFKTHGK